MSDGTSVRECWDCGGREFHLLDGEDGGFIAVCETCGGRKEIGHLYRTGDPTDRDVYDLSMEHTEL